MQRSLNRSSAGRRIFGVPTVGILAEQIAAETATGDHGAGILNNEALQPEHAGKYLRARMLSFPATGTLFVHENGAYDITGLPDGTYVFPYEFDVDNVLQPGTASLTVTLGAVDATAPGATLTGSASITPGAATGEVNATAPGADLTGTASITPGAATGAASGSAPGATLTGTASITPGAATGQSNVAAPGATLTGTASLAAGTAEALNGGTAPGSTLTGTATLTPGAATGEVSATAPGASLTGTSSLNAGAATGDIDASAPGATLTGAASLIPGMASNGEGLAPGPDRYRIRAPARSWRVKAIKSNFVVTK